MGKLVSEKERKLQRKLIPLNIFVCILALVAAFSLIFAPIFKVDFGKILQSDATKRLVDEQIGKIVGDTTEGLAPGDVDFMPVIAAVVSNVLSKAEGKIEFSTFNASKVAFASGDEKANKFLDEMFFGENALVTKLIDSIADNVVGMFQTPEGKIIPAGRDWEACMTFNGISWGYLDSERVKPYSHSPQQIARMLYEVTKESGNLLLNIGPKADGSIPAEAVEPLEKIGMWIRKNQGFLYGRTDAKQIIYHGSSNLTFSGNKAYVWNFFWPEQDHTIYVAGIQNRLEKAYFIASGNAVKYVQDDYRIVLKNLPDEEEDRILGITVICLEFDGEVSYWGEGFNRHATRYPQLNGGAVYKRE